MTDLKNGNLIAVMANTVAQARHMLTVPEQRLVLWLIAQIDREDDALKDYILSVPEFEEILGHSNNGRLYEQIEASCDRLQTRVLEIHTGERIRKKFNWMHQVEYLDGEGKVRLRFHDNLKPVLLQLRERFCKIPLKSVFKLRSGYAIRWLEMLYSRKHEGAFYLSVEELRDWLHIEPGELKTTAHLYQRAIDYPRRDLNKKAPLTFTSEPRKIGRKISGWTFTIKENKPKPQRRKGKAKAETAPSPPVDETQRAEYAAALSGLKSAIAGGIPAQTAPEQKIK